MQETELNLEELIRYLDRRGTNWTNSANLIQVFRCHKRHICRLADESEGRIISSVNGYKLQDHATKAEVMAAYGHLTDLITALQARATALITRHHHHERRANLPDPDKNQLPLL